MFVMRVSLQRTLLILAACGLALTTAACRENEQGRMLIHKKGVYQGPTDQPRDQATREDLQRRVNYQRSP